MRLTYLAVVAAGGLAAIAAPSASAQIFASAGYTQFKVDVPGDDVTLGALTGRVAVGVAPFVSLEGEVSTGVKDDDYTLGANTYNVSLANEIGAFVVGRVPAPAIGSVFARAGFVNTSIDTNGPAIDDGGGLAYGAGFELDVLPFIRGRLEYTKYEGAHAEGLSASAAIKF
jgi:hypothetical protein